MYIIRLKCPLNVSSALQTRYTDFPYVDTYPLLGCHHRPGLCKILTYGINVCELLIVKGGQGCATSSIAANADKIPMITCNKEIV